MEIDETRFKIVMDDRREDGSVESIVLVWARDLEVVRTSFMAVKLKYRKRNVYLRDGARIIDQNLGEPRSIRI